jgi:dTDP-4-amino-4,6-dideoxygalactose transaminase
MNDPIYVTQPSLAPLGEYVEYLETIWKSGVMTHNGPLVQQLEKELCQYLNVKHVVCVSNGTCALQLSLRALELKGEVITTPFTFIATTNIIQWERCRPVFVDIEPDAWNIDPAKIENKISADTTGILPVHVFSAPCDVQRIKEIADKHDLKVIYDAAHAMCVDVNGMSIMSFGDISCVSFHATKLFNTAEGGACVTADDNLAERLRRLRFFGFDEEKNIVDHGMNAKMTEVHAGLGLANLKWLDQVMQHRREKYELYRECLSKIPYVALQKINPQEYNYSYMPVLFESEAVMLRVKEKLVSNNIYPRRYFYPSMNTVPVFQMNIRETVSERISSSILCLPLYDTLPDKDIEWICHCIESL